MPDTLTGQDWNELLRSIHAQGCIPFLGAGACVGSLPLGGDVAAEWAASYNYPLSDTRNLSRVAQYIKICVQPMRPKYEMLDRLSNSLPADNQLDEPHAMLAELPLPLFMTTNYDTFMTQALERNYKLPKRVMARWNGYLKQFVAGYDETHLLSPATPVVFHLHGSVDEAQSLVLTEDDYLEFLVTMTRDKTLLPQAIQHKMSASSLLFIGYSLADINFRALLRGLYDSIGDINQQQNYAVQPLPVPETATEVEKQRAQSYLTKYFEELSIRVYWGTAREFTRDLRAKWTLYRSGTRF